MASSGEDFEVRDRVLTQAALETLKPLCGGSRAIRPSTAGSMNTAILPSRCQGRTEGKDGRQGQQLVVWDGNGPFPGLFWVRKIHIMFLLRLY